MLGHTAEHDTACDVCAGRHKVSTRRRRSKSKSSREYKDALGERLLQRGRDHAPLVVCLPVPGGTIMVVVGGKQKAPKRPTDRTAHRTQHTKHQTPNTKHQSAADKRRHARPVTSPSQHSHTTVTPQSHHSHTNQQPTNAKRHSKRNRLQEIGKKAYLGLFWRHTSQLTPASLVPPNIGNGS